MPHVKLCIVLLVQYSYYNAHLERVEEGYSDCFTYATSRRKTFSRSTKLSSSKARMSDRLRLFDSGNIRRNLGNIRRDSGNIWRDSGNIWRDLRSTLYPPIGRRLKLGCSTCAMSSSLRV
jgi:hypothetical protein